MQVAIVAPEGLPIPPTKGGSIQIYLDALCRTLAAYADVSLTLISPGDSTATLPGIQHITINGTKDDYRKQSLQELARLSPDIVQIENRPSLYHRVRKTAPHAHLLLNLHSTTFLSPRHISQDRAIDALQGIDAVVVNSKYLREEIGSKFHIRRKDWNVRVIHPGVDIGRFQGETDSVRQSPHAIRDRINLLFVGRVIEQKGVHVLIAAMRHLKYLEVPAQLTVIGNTPRWERKYREKLHKTADGLPVRFIGFVDPSNLPPYLHDAHVLLCPSQRSEAFGMVNIEAMAAGVPVIGSRQGGIPEIVDASSGILVDNYTNPVSFARHIQTLYNEPDRLVHLAKGARKRAAAFAWSQTAQKFYRLYRKLQNS